jgi:hypothetical protein
MKLTPQELNERSERVAKYMGSRMGAIAKVAAILGIVMPMSNEDEDGFTQIAINAAVGGYVDKVLPLSELPEEGEEVYLLMPDGSTLCDVRFSGGLFVRLYTREPLRVAPLGWWPVYVPQLTSEEFETLKRELKESEDAENERAQDDKIYKEQCE